MRRLTTTVALAAVALLAMAATASAQSMTLTGTLDELNDSGAAATTTMSLDGTSLTVAVEGTTPEGTRRLVEADAIEARALLHELDHLDGLLFLDRVTSAATDLFRRRRYR